MVRRTLNRIPIVPPEDAVSGADTSPLGGEPLTREDAGDERSYAMPTVHEVVAAPVDAADDDTW